MKLPAVESHIPHCKTTELSSVQSRTGFPLESIPAKAGAGMTDPNSVMPAKPASSLYLKMLPVVFKNFE
jgi:hypothetical protein